MVERRDESPTADPTIEVNTKDSDTIRYRASSSIFTRDNIWFNKSSFTGIWPPENGSEGVSEVIESYVIDSLPDSTSDMLYWRGISFWKKYADSKINSLTVNQLGINRMNKDEKSKDISKTLTNLKNDTSNDTSNDFQESEWYAG